MSFVSVDLTQPCGATAEEVADLVVFPASDRAGNITGSDYRIDGRYVATV